MLDERHKSMFVKASSRKFYVVKDQKQLILREKNKPNSEKIKKTQQSD